MLALTRMPTPGGTRPSTSDCQGRGAMRLPNKKAVDPTSPREGLIKTFPSKRSVVPVLGVSFYWLRTRFQSLRRGRSQMSFFGLS